MVEDYYTMSDEELLGIEMTIQQLDYQEVCVLADRLGLSLDPEPEAADRCSNPTPRVQRLIDLLAPVYAGDFLYEIEEIEVRYGGLVHDRCMANG